MEDRDRVRGRTVTLKWVMVSEYEGPLPQPVRIWLPAGMGLVSWVLAIDNPVSEEDLKVMVKM